MRTFLIPIVFIFAAGFIVFGLSGPILDEIETVSERKADLSVGLANAKEVQEELSVLLEEFNKLSREDMADIDLLIPDTVDNVKLIIDVNGVAENSGMVIRNITLESEDRSIERNNNSPTTEVDSAKSALVGAGSMEVGSILIGFSVEGPYKELQLFLADLSKSLRLVDIESLKFVGGDEDLSQYDIVLRTYWLK